MKKMFVLGCPRSGSTMLQQALNRHSQIAIPAETKFFCRFYGRSRAAQWTHLARLNADLGIRLPRPAQRVGTPGDARAFYDRMAAAYVQQLGKPEVAYFGDKTPEHTGHLQRLREVFPEARLVFLVRDGRDVALSLSKVPWIRCDVYLGMIVWLYYYDILKTCRNDPGNNIYFVRYEELAHSPVETLKGVLEFLGLPYEPAVAEQCGEAIGIPARELLWKSRALEKITAERVGVWARELTPRQSDMLEALARRALTDLGYPVTESQHRRVPAWLLLRLCWSLAKLGWQLPPGYLWHELTGAGLESGVLGTLARVFKQAIGVAPRPRHDSLAAPHGELASP